MSELILPSQTRSLSELHSLRPTIRPRSLRRHRHRPRRPHGRQPRQPTSPRLANRRRRCRYDRPRPTSPVGSISRPYDGYLRRSHRYGFLADLYQYGFGHYYAACADSYFFPGGFLDEGEHGERMGAAE